MINPTECTHCGLQVKTYNSINVVTEQGTCFCLCFACYNKKVSQDVGISYEHLELQPIVLQDAHDIEHTFHFSTRLFGEKHILSAFEIEGDYQGGYEFSVIGDEDDGVFEVFSKLYEKMLNALSRKHIYKDDHTDKWYIDKDNMGSELTKGTLR